MAAMHAATWLCVKAIYAPPRFRIGTANQLLMCMLAGSLLSFLPFALVVLAPR